MAVERTATFAEHIGELRRRLMWTMLFVAIGSVAGYVLQDKLLQVLQRPLNEQLYYTNPTGAFSFVIKLSAVFGIIAALPVALYQGFAFFEPLIKARTRRLIVWSVALSVFLAGCGLAFAYFISLPAALHFLVNFGGEDIQSLITANEYFNFVLAYLAGFALLFQLPLVLAFINRVTPLTPSKLLGGTRYVVLGSFIVAAIITPTPDPLNQLLMAGPVILLYFLSTGIIIVKNSSSRRKSKHEQVQSTYEPAVAARVVPSEPVAFHAKAEAPRAQARSSAPRRINDVVVPGRNVTVPTYHRRPATPVAPQQATGRTSRLISDFVPVSE